MTDTPITDPLAEAIAREIKELRRHVKQNDEGIIIGEASITLEFIAGSLERILKDWRGE